MNKVKLKKTILLSMRDAAAAHFILPLIEFLQEDEKYEIQIVAQEPAASILENRRVKFLLIDLPTVLSSDGNSAQDLLSQARLVVGNVRPDLIVVGHSSSGGGIDEALIKLKTAPIILIQDFWGEINTFFGELPDYVFTFDRFSTSLTSKKYDVSCFEIGSLRHQAYHSLSPQKIRQHYRQKLFIDEGPVAGWFGQSLHKYSGYRETVKVWAETMCILKEKNCHGSPRHFVYKPHPLETQSDIEATQRILKILGRVRLLVDAPVEEALCLCDSVSAVMSNCLYDAAYINKVAGEPFITPLSILISNDLYRELSKTIDFTMLPYQRSGLASVIRAKRKMIEELSLAHTKEKKQVYFNSSQVNLNCYEGVLNKAGEYISNCLDIVIRR